MKYLIDTSWAISALRGDQSYVARIEILASEGICISVISVAELYEGVYTSRDQEREEQALRRLVDAFVVLDVDHETARIFGRERRRLRAEGAMISDMDLMIAATALQHGLTVLTDNRRHFERVEGLAVESR